MKFLTTLLATLLVLSLFSTPSLASTKTKVGIVSADNINIRTGPGTNFKSLGTVKKGTKLTILSITKNKWSKISFKKKTAYISNKYLSSNTTTSLKGYNGN